MRKKKEKLTRIGKYFIDAEKIDLKNNLLDTLFDLLRIFLVCSIVYLLFQMFFGCDVVRAEVTSNLAIKAIIGEAEGEPLQGKIAIAEAIRNKDSLSGVYGLNSPRAKNPSSKQISLAKKAWEISKDSNLTNGATVWGNKSDVKIFQKTKWFKKYKQTAVIGNHYFFAQKGN